MVQVKSDELSDTAISAWVLMLILAEFPLMPSIVMIVMLSFEDAAETTMYSYPVSMW